LTPANLALCYSIDDVAPRSTSAFLDPCVPK
jgi:hypothetical protein